ncbi:hypothetical protein FJTKL_06004 [Diaporthe vaccinii]|uniref:Uncharacterized protein n=1 Tax=Diaporthe vaccinii TaxID=105482 RepID=A0ABR4DQV4_9PEZI
MGRTLPWKPAGHPSTPKPPTAIHPTASASPPPGTSLSRAKPAAPSARSTLVSGPVPPRSPATSPAHPRTDGSASLPSSPCRPSEAPLPESFMVEGFDNDDRWRMVEDEFYSVAARFTAHLHAAQYRRLKDEAKKQNPTIHTLARPVTHPPTSEVVRRQAASTLAASQRRAIATAKLHSKASGSGSAAAAQPGDEDSDRFQYQTPRKRTHLASLLDSPRKRAQPLTSIATSHGKARAAAINTSSQPTSLGIRTGTPSPSAKAISFATHHKISMSTAKTAHAHYRPRGIPERAAVGGGLTPGLVRPQSDHDSNVDDIEQHTVRSYGTLQANHLIAAASRKTETEGDISARDEAPQKPMPTDHASQTPTPQPAEVNDGSDSGSETYFQQRLRARRRKSKPQRGHRHPTPDEPSGKDASQARPKSQGTSNAALSVPSI